MPPLAVKRNRTHTSTGRKRETNCSIGKHDQPASQMVKPTMPLHVRRNCAHNPGERSRVKASSSYKGTVDVWL